MWAAEKENPTPPAEQTETCPGDTHLPLSAGVLSGPDPEQGRLPVTATHTQYPPKGLLRCVLLHSFCWLPLLSYPRVNTNFYMWPERSRLASSCSSNLLPIPSSENPCGLWSRGGFSQAVIQAGGTARSKQGQWWSRVNNEIRLSCSVLYINQAWKPPEMVTAQCPWTPCPKGRLSSWGRSSSFSPVGPSHVSVHACCLICHAQPTRVCMAVWLEARWEGRKDGKKWAEDSGGCTASPYWQTLPTVSPLELPVLTLNLQELLVSLHCSYGRKIK